VFTVDTRHGHESGNAVMIWKVKRWMEGWTGGWMDTVVTPHIPVAAVR